MIVKCCNCGCDKEVTKSEFKRKKKFGSNIFCGLKCATKYQNRLKHEKYLNIYLSAPKKCPQCNSIISYEDRHKKTFCSHSCSATFNNAQKEKKEHGHCQCCGKKLPRKGRKFCSSKCCGDFRKKQTILLIESGDTTLPAAQYKKYLIEKHGDKCMKCGWDKKNPVTGNVTVELNHIDGHSENNCLSNLEIICPNCHSLTPNYKALNRGNGRKHRR